MSTGYYKLVDGKMVELTEDELQAILAERQAEAARRAAEQGGA